MLDRFSDHSRVILTQVSKKVAYEMKSREVKPEHVLLAIDEDPKSVGARIIGKTVPEGVIRKEVEEASKTNTNGDFKESDVRFSMAVEKLMDVALNEADSLNDQMIGTEHLILGILKDDPASTACGILQKLGFTYDAVRKVIEATVQKTPAPQKVKVRDIFAIVHFDVAVSDEELQFLLYAIERFKGVSFVNTMKMKPEDTKTDDPGDAPKIILPGQY